MRRSPPAGGQVLVEAIMRTATILTFQTRRRGTMAHVGPRPAAAAAPAAAPAEPTVSTGANVVFWAATAISVLYTGLVAVVLLLPSKVFGSGWTAWLKDWWGAIALGYVCIQQLQHYFGPVADWQRYVNRGTEFLPLLPLFVGVLSPVIKWGFWEMNIAWTVGFAVLACVIGSFSDWRR